MTGRSPFLRLGAALFVFVNIAGAAYAVAMGEPMHAVTHVVVLLAGFGAYAMWQRSRADQYESPGAREALASLDHLQQSVDAIAVEVERIGEAQRFETRLLKERVEKSSPKKE